MAEEPHRQLIEHKPIDGSTAGECLSEAATDLPISGDRRTGFGRAIEVRVR